MLRNAPARVRVPGACLVAGLLGLLSTAFALADDCNLNGVPDETEPDCNGDGIPDECAPWGGLDWVSGGVPPAPTAVGACWPALSADGATVVFGVRHSTSAVTADDHVYIRNRATGETTPLPGYGGSIGAAVSADGRYVAFHYFNGGLVSMPVNGGNVYLLDRQTDEVELVSQWNGTGLPANSPAAYGGAAISADGRYVVFDCIAPLVATDDNECSDIYLRDRFFGITTRITIAGDGDANGSSALPAITPDGRYIVFSSKAGNLTDQDVEPGVWRVHRHDRMTGQTIIVGETYLGQPLLTKTTYGDISADGSRVVFQAAPSTGLGVPSDAGDQVFVRDFDTGETTLVSVNLDGGFGDGASGLPRIADNGRYVVFRSDASDLVPDDTNGAPDYFRHDLVLGLTTRISVNDAGEGQQVDGPETLQPLQYRTPAINADGSRIAFPTRAGNLAEGAGGDDYEVFVRELLTCSQLCSGDIAPGGGDMSVSAPDLLAVIAAYGEDGPHPADFAAPTGVGIEDIIQLLINWGPCIAE